MCFLLIKNCTFWKDNHFLGKPCFVTNLSSKDLSKMAFAMFFEVDYLVQVHPLLAFINKVCVAQLPLGFQSQTLDKICSFGKDFFRDPFVDQETMSSQTLNERQDFYVFERAVGDNPEQMRLMDYFQLCIAGLGTKYHMCRSPVWSEFKTICQQWWSTSVSS